MAYFTEGVKAMAHFTEDETAYMEYLDDLYNVPDGYGRLLFNGDPIAFQVGMNEWLRENAKPE